MTSVTPDTAAVSSVVESVAVLADRAEFDALARLFADEFMLDYSSLNGQPAGFRKPLDLMMEWAAVLPGFDRTRHVLSDIIVNITGNTATAGAGVIASHWIGTHFWQVEGRYEYKLSKTGGGWQIPSMVFVLDNEQGSREVFGPAMAAAKHKRLSGHKVATGERNKATVRTFSGCWKRKTFPPWLPCLRSRVCRLTRIMPAFFPPVRVAATSCWLTGCLCPTGLTECDFRSTSCLRPRIPMWFSCAIAVRSE